MSAWDERAQAYRSEHINVAVHVSAINRDQQISRRSGKSIEVICKSRIT